MTCFTAESVLAACICALVFAICAAVHTHPFGFINAGAVMTFQCGYCGSAGLGSGIQLRCFKDARTIEVRRGCDDDCSRCESVERYAFGSQLNEDGQTFTLANDTFACQGIAYLRYDNSTCSDNITLHGPKYRDSLASGACRSEYRLTCTSGGGVDVHNCITGKKLPFSENSCFAVDNQWSMVQCVGDASCISVTQT